MGNAEAEAIARMVAKQLEAFRDELLAARRSSAAVSREKQIEQADALLGALRDYLVRSLAPIIDRLNGLHAEIDAMKGRR